jgi:hypothetical protein
VPSTEKWIVLGRREYQEPLTRVGAVDAASRESVGAAAKRELGEDWLELVAIPESRIAWAIREE